MGSENWLKSSQFYDPHFLCDWVVDLLALFGEPMVLVRSLSVEHLVIFTEYFTLGVFAGSAIPLRSVVFP